MPKIKGEIYLPGDKSISHRAALFSAFIAEEARFTNFNFNQDCAATLDCLKALGIEWKLVNHELLIRGKAIDHWQEPKQILDAKNSGTTARLLSGILAALPFQTKITGDDSLSKRPMARVIIPLQQMGAHVESSANHLPLVFKPVQKLRGIQYRMPVASAQVKSAVLLAGLFSEGLTEIIEAMPSRDHTERMLNLKYHKNEDGSSSIFSSKEVSFYNLSMEIPGDFSSAAFFIVAALMIPESEIILQNISLNPTRTGLLKVLKTMGAEITPEVSRERPEPIGRLKIKHRDLHNVEIPLSLVPNIIDEIPILCILATQARGQFVLRGAQELRYKESDRISAMVENLKNLGIKVEELPDGLTIEGPQNIPGGPVKTFNDHRIAMSFAIANLLAKTEIILDNPACVAVSFPAFFETLNKITIR